MASGSGLHRKLRALLRDRRGNVGVAAGLALGPLLVAGGVAIDYGRASGARTALQAALDAGVVAAATESNGHTLTALTQTVTTFVDSNKGKFDYKNLVVSVTAPDDWTVAATASACIDLVFGNLLGRSQQCFNGSAEANRGKNHLEVVMALDNTGSMEGARITALRNAATLLVDKLQAAATGSRTVKIALVPFVTAVNVKGAGFDMAWMDQTALNPLHGNNFDPPAGSPAGTKVNHFTLFNNIQVTWKGCVEARPAPYNLDDTPPSIANPSTMFVPYFAPDEPGNAAAGGNSATAYNNSYLNDGGQGQRSIAKYVYTSPRPTPIVETAPNVNTGTNITNGPNRACPTPIVPLTNDFSKLKTNIAAMRHWNGSGTNVSEGLAWAWRVLSPEPPYTDGKPFSDPTVQKVVVLLTDGENVVYGASSTANKSDYGPYGFLAGGRFAATDQTNAARKVDSWVQQTCTALKSRGVMIYTITLEADTTANRALYAPCASKPEMYYPSPSSTQLSGIFGNIAAQLIALKLTK
jgi:Flp pilus assembly protein TadG